MQPADFFELYEVGKQYYLPTLADFNLVPMEIQPLYGVDERTLFNDIPPSDNGEPFVQVKGVHCLLDEAMYLRKGVAERLQQAEQHLKQLSDGKYRLCLTDAFRSVQRQRRQFETIKAKLAKTGLAGEALQQATLQLISDPDLQPPHATGGAVDLTMCETETGKEAWLGTPVDAIDTEAVKLWYKDLPEEVRTLRTLLYTAMTQAGFVHTCLEWWHFSYGDVEWALRTHQATTLYGPVRDLNTNNL